MMNKNITFKALKYTALSLICAGAVLLTVAMLTVYEPATSYFPPSTTLPLLAVLCTFLGAVCGGVAVFLGDCNNMIASPFSLPAALSSGIGFLLGGILLLLNATLPWSVPTALFFFAAALYAFLSGTSYVKERSSFMAFLGFLTVIACALGNVYCYFDISLEMNAPVKIILQTALLFSMIYYTGEIRFLLGREKKRFYLILAFCALAANALSAFAFPITYFQGALARIDYFALSVSSLGMFLSLFARILFYTTRKKEFAVCDEDICEPVKADSDFPSTVNEEDISSSNDDDLTEKQKETDEE